MNLGEISSSCGIAESGEALVARAEALIREFPGCFWFRHPDARVRVRDPATGQLARHGESGEIEIKCASQLLSYLDNPDATAQAYTPDLFFKTGDLGYTVSETQFVFQTRMGDSMRLS
jgi:acyl-CoA synthetase (AMP-forming)/AMP-acid ligase II